MARIIDLDEIQRGAARRSAFCGTAPRASDLPGTVSSASDEPQRAPSANDAESGEPLAQTAEAPPPRANDDVEGGDVAVAESRATRHGGTDVEGAAGPDTPPSDPTV